MVPKGHGRPCAMVSNQPKTRIKELRPSGGRLRSQNGTKGSKLKSDQRLCRFLCMYEYSWQVSTVYEADDLQKSIASVYKDRAIRSPSILVHDIYAIGSIKLVLTVKPWD